MFARHIKLELKSNVAKEFPVVFEKEILPILRRQKGFLEELILATPSKTEVVAISLWEEKEFAEAYNRQVYPEVAKIIAKFVEETPIVTNFEVEYATYRKYATVTV
jgi:heme-degrading monooxygenase HmoA